MSIETDVLISGAGPVGLSLAAELGMRGIRTIVVEERTAVTTHPKATLLGSRSMEFFRRWGIVDQVLAAGLPIDRTYDVVFCTKLQGWELYRYKTPSARELIVDRVPAAVARQRELQWSPYFKTQIGQQALEPVLRNFASSFSSVSLQYGKRLTQFDQTEQGVRAEVVDMGRGATDEVRAQYLVGCDGGSSNVRKGLSFKYVGRGAMRPNVSFFFRSEEFLRKHSLGHGNLYFIFSPESFGVFTAIDGHSLWNYQYYFLDASRATQDVDPAKALYAAMGEPFRFELLSTMHWHHHQSVAEKFQSGRVFLAGDSAHLFSPTGGLGMNTGIGDAVDLGWKLWGTLAGWGGPRLLESYEAERKPVAVRNTMATAMNADRIDMVMRETPALIDEPTNEAAMERAALSRKLKWLARQFNTAGLHLGYRYYDSPIVIPDNSPEPPDDSQQLTPSTWPGMRAPHAWMRGGISTLDLYRGRFTLVCMNAGPERGASMQQAALDLGVPLDIALVDDATVAALYERDFVLVRPDGHVAWRGQSVPENSRHILDLARGAAASG